MKYVLPNGITISMIGADVTDSYDANEYGVYIDGPDGEIVSWTGDEWIEDPAVVASIINALMSAVRDGPEALRNRIA